MYIIYYLNYKIDIMCFVTFRNVQLSKSAKYYLHNNINCIMYMQNDLLNTVKHRLFNL